MALEEKAAKYLRETGNYKVLKNKLSQHIHWSVINLPLDPNTPNFATLYSGPNLVNFAVSVGFNTNG